MTPRGSVGTAPIERTGSNDLLQTSFGSAPAETQIGAILVLATESPLDVSLVRTAIADRLQAVPRLRQRLVKPPAGCGRPVWVDDAGFDASRHVTPVLCPAPGDERALLDLAADTVATLLPSDRPLWSLTLVHGLAGGRTGLILTFHHVLTDGVGGLAVLATLVDGVPPRPPLPFPRPPPTRRQLAADAMAARLRAVAGLPATLSRLAAATAQLRPGLARPAPRCTLNRPTGRHRSLGVARTDLAAVRSAASAHGATVNDVVLAAVAGALHGFLVDRGDPPLDELVVGLLVSGRPAGDGVAAGNQVGVVPVTIPAGGDGPSRLTATASATRVAKSGPRGASAALLEPVFRSLAALHVVRWFIGRQRRVNTFVTNLRGPREHLAFLGAPVSEVVPVNGTAGNVGVAFGVLSYAGTLTVTVVADRDVCPDVATLAGHLQRELDGLVAAGGALSVSRGSPPPGSSRGARPAGSPSRASGP